MPDFDVEYIRGRINEKGLDPVPERRHEPIRSRVGDVMVQIEKYAWGYVIFAQDAARGTGATWIEFKGMYHCPKGTPRWAVEAREQMRPPQCYGRFQGGDPQCEGSTEDPVPCGWQKLCARKRMSAGKFKVPREERKRLKKRADAIASVEAAQPDLYRDISDEVRVIVDEMVDEFLETVASRTGMTPDDFVKEDIKGKHGPNVRVSFQGSRMCSFHPNVSAKGTLKSLHLRVTVSRPPQELIDKLPEAAECASMFQLITFNCYDGTLIPVAGVVSRWFTNGDLKCTAT